MASNSLDFLLNLRANTTGFDQGINGAKFAVNALVGAMAALGAGLGVKELLEAADSYAKLSAKIQQSTKDSGNFEQAIAGVHQIALQTNSTLDNTGTLFTRLNTVAKDMGKSQQFALDMTSTVTKAIQLGGSSTQEAEGAVTQFIQAMQGGVLRGEEFNSIMEGGYGLAEALAKGLGVTTGELRKMAEAGELSAERVLAALEKQKAGIDAQYAEMPLTISNALQKIATSWQILIGEMDQANGASATVANALSVIADNLGILKVFFDDVAAGVGYLSSKFSDIDPTVLNSLRDTLAQLYEGFKQNLQYIVQFGETAWSAFTSALDAAAPLFNTLLGGGENVSGLTTLINVLRMAMAAVSDVAFGLNIGFKTILASIQFLAGGVYALSSAILGFLGFDTLAQQAMNASDRMFAQAEKNGKDIVRLSQEHKWAVVETYNEIGKTAEQKNADRITNNEKTLADLKAQEAKHVTDYKAISDERIKLQQQLVDARKSGDQSAIDAALAGLAELDKKEKAYQAESKKISDEKIKAAQDLVNAQIEASTKGGVALSDNAKKTIEASVAARGLAVEFDKTGKAIVKAIEQEAGGAVVSLETKMGKGRKAAAVFAIDLDKELNKVSSAFTEKSAALDSFAKNLEALGATGQQAADLVYQAWLKFLSEAKSPAEVDAGIAKLQELAAQGKITGEQLSAGLKLADAAAKDLSPELQAAREAGKALGIDIDKTANIMSQGFGQGSANLDTLKQKLEEAGITGKEASNTLYQAWIAWLDKADSQVEIDAAKAELKEFESQGVLSAKQVEMGMLHLDEVNGKLPQNISEVEKAYKLLGITSREEANKMADSQVKAFNVMMNSGTASAENIKQALINMADKVYASGDAAKIAWYEAKLSANGLQSSVDSLGKASVKSMDELSKSVEKVGRTASGSAAQGFRELGRVAKQEAEEVAETWEKTMARVDKERKAQAAETAKGLSQLSDGQNSMAQDFYNQLIAGGMDASRAEALKEEAVTRMNNQLREALNGSVSGRADALAGRNASKDWMDDILKGQKRPGSVSSPRTPSIQAPNVNTSVANVPSSSAKTVTYKIDFGGKSLELAGDPNQQNLMNDFLNELEQAKKAM